MQQQSVQQQLPQHPLHQQLEHEPLVDGELDTSDITRSASASGRIDVKNHRYPFSLVWGPLPVITWLIPFIGHLGIADSEGRVHDFNGPFSIGVGDFMVPISKYYQLPREVWAGHEHSWDAGVAQADSVYKRKMHNIVTQNCHHHSACALASMKLGPAAVSADLQRMSMLRAWWLITTRGHCISASAWLMTYAPFLCILVLTIVLAVKL